MLRFFKNFFFYNLILTINYHIKRNENHLIPNRTSLNRKKEIISKNKCTFNIFLPNENRIILQNLPSRAHIFFLNETGCFLMYILVFEFDLMVLMN